MLIPAEVLTIAKTEQGDAVLIKPKGTNIAVPILIGSAEADSILLGIRKVKIPRPLTHDLLISTLDTLDVFIKRIEITELQNSTFYAKLIIIQNGEEISIDSRPSDCIAIAVRTKCDMYIDEIVVDEAGIPLSSSDDDDEVGEHLIGALKSKLEEAVEDENYEEAAVIRDKINELEKTV